MPVFVPKSSSGSGPSRSVTMALIVGILSVVVGVVDHFAFDLPYIENGGEALRFGLATIIAAFGLRRVGK